MAERRLRSENEQLKLALAEQSRVWQIDFSEFETTAAGIWRICAVIDYATKYCLAVTIGPTSRAQDAVTVGSGQRCS